MPLDPRDQAFRVRELPVVLMDIHQKSSIIDPASQCWDCSSGIWGRTESSVCAAARLSNSSTLSELEQASGRSSIISSFLVFRMLEKTMS